MRCGRKTLATLTGTALAAGLATPALGATAAVTAPYPGVAAATAGGTGKLVTEWNSELVSILSNPKAQPATIHPTRSFAILQAAEYDAVVSITHHGPAYLSWVRASRRARPDAAANQAAHDVLTALYPARRAHLDTRLSTLLGAIPNGHGKDEGKRVGAVAAERLLKLRAGDGSAAAKPPRFVPGTAAGDYRRTPPRYADPVYRNWGQVTPFALDTAGQFRPPAPPAVSGAPYAKALNEVKRLGGTSGTSRTADQTAAGRFWSATAVWTLWNQVAQAMVNAQHSSLEQAVRVFADLDLSLADTTIALYDAKYVYHVWRPVTAIRLGGTHYNRDIVGDPRWTPLLPTAPDPSYPSAHSALSEAAAKVLTTFYGKHRPLAIAATGGATRGFASFQAAATEAGLSRIWSGQHTRLDHQAGRQLGATVAAFVLHGLGRAGARRWAAPSA